MSDGAGVRPRGAVQRGARAALAHFRDRDHTRAGLLGSVFVLALPSMLTGIFGQGLFQVVELRFLGALGSDAVAAAGAGNQILRQAFFLPTFGLAIAVQMWIALQIGRGRVEEAERAAGQSFVIGAVLALAAAVAGLFVETLMGWVTRDPAVYALGTIYMRITFFTLSGVIATTVFSSVLMGAGESTTPMLVTVLTTPLTIAVQWVLTFGGFGIPPLGIAGIALGTGVGGLFGTAVSLYVLFRGHTRVNLRLRHLVPRAPALRELLSVSWQPTAHFLARSLIIMLFMALAGRLGGSVQAAYTIGLRLEIMAAMVAFPIASACATLVGQNLGAGDRQRAWRAIAVSMAAVTGVMGPFALGFFVFRHELAGWFSDDPVVAAMAAEYLFYMAPLLVFYGFYFVSLRTLQAAGDMNSPMLISVTLVLFLGAPLGYGLSIHTALGPTGLWIANLAYGACNSTCMVAWLLTGRWANRRRATEASDHA